MSEIPAPFSSPPMPIQGVSLPFPTIIQPTGTLEGLPVVPPPPTESTPEERVDPAEIGFTRFAPYIAAFASTVYNPDALIQNTGWDTLDDMKAMGVYGAPLNLKRYGLLYLGYSFKSAVDSTKDPEHAKANEIRDFVEYAFENIANDKTGGRQNFRDWIWHVTDAFHAGFNLSTYTWKSYANGKYKGKWGISSFTPRTPKEVGFVVDPMTLETMYFQLFNLYNANLNPQNNNYIAIPLDRAVHACYNPKYGLPFGWGDARVCYKHTLYLSEAFRYWMIAVERGSIPFLKVGTLDNPQRRAALGQLLDNVRQGASLVYSKGIDEVEAMQLMSPQVATIFEGVSNYHSGQITQYILGQTLTTQQGKSGSYGQWQAHENTQEFVFANSKKVVSAAFESIIRYLVKYNFGEEYIHLAPYLDFGDLNVSMRQQIANVMSVYSQYGMYTEEDDNAIRKQLGLPRLNEEFVPNAGKADTTGSAVQSGGQD